MKNIRLIKVLAVLSFIVIALSFIVVLSHRYQIKLSSNKTGWGINMNIKQTQVKFKTKIHEKVSPAENIEATVGVNSLNIRKQPSLSSSVVGKLNLGTKITIRDEQSGWAKIESSSGIQEWVYINYISKDLQPVNSSTLSTQNMENGQQSLKGKIIVIDPSHGGIDDGTTSIVGTFEKTLTLATANVVEKKLEDAGATVIMTRTDDTYIPLMKRAEISNQNHADAFISFHYNCFNDPSKNGLTDFYYQKSKDYDLATDILNKVVKTTGLNNDGTRFDNLEVLRNNTQPSTLIELGFLSNHRDDSIVENSSYPDKVAQGVYLGLLDYFSTKKQVATENQRHES